MPKTWYSFLLCWLSLRLEANPGLKVRITQKGLDYGRRIGMELLKQEVQKETFPSWSGRESFSVVKVNYVISSWIYSFLSGYLEKPIHTKLNKNLCLNIKYKIQMMDAQLRKHTVLNQIDAFAQIDYSLVSSPAVFKSHMNLDLKGTVYPAGNHTDPPFVPALFALPNKDDSMLYLGVSSYFLKSASLAYYRAGAFNITMSKELATTFNLNTALFKDLVPEIALSYLTACPVLLKLVATSPPEVSLNADRCILQITGCVEVFAVLPHSTTQYIFAGNLGHLVISTDIDYK
ncbi:PREDICTED: BPI fold-containing family C protein-like, partial [Nestor notabilis]|uniref:BPI fold-containing family C protein-like n=1 Tax=Nestor notabilis TaxID=176057 RepID=UPI000523776D